MTKLLEKNSVKNMRNKLPAVDFKHYTEKYFLNWGNYNEFLKNKGNNVEHFPIYKKVIEIAQIKPGMKVLDLGCGRGELVVCAARLGAKVEGIDYSKTAIKMAKQSVAIQPKEVQSRITLKRADVKNLDLPENYYDRIFMVDLIEHLRPWEVDFILPKIKRALKKSGYLIIHTFPNRLAFYGFGLYKFWYYLAYGEPLKETFRDNYYDPIMHVNEQTPFMLEKSLKKHGFCYYVWLEKGYFFNMLELGAKHSQIKKLIVKIIQLWPFNLFFFIDIYALAWKNEKQNSNF